jgi:hypothetical protein
VLAHILLASLNSTKFLTLDLTSLLNRLGQVALPLDATDFGHVGVSLDKCLVVFELGTLTSTLDTAAVGGLGTPETNITIVRPRQHIFVIRCEFGRENTRFIISKMFLKNIVIFTYRCIRPV